MCLFDRIRQTKEERKHKVDVVHGVRQVDLTVIFDVVISIMAMNP